MSLSFCIFPKSLSDILLSTIRREIVLRLGGNVGPGVVATWGKSVVDKTDVMGFKWERKGQSSKHISFEWSGP